MAYGVQAADLCVYCLNWGWRLRDITEPAREEIRPIFRLMEKSICQGEGYRDGKVFKTSGTVIVPDPYEGRPRADEVGA